MTLHEKQSCLAFPTPFENTTRIYLSTLLFLRVLFRSWNNLGFRAFPRNLTAPGGRAWVGVGAIRCKGGRGRRFVLLLANLLNLAENYDAVKITILQNYDLDLPEIVKIMVFELFQVGGTRKCINLSVRFRSSYN